MARFVCIRAEVEKRRAEVAIDVISPNPLFYSLLRSSKNAFLVVPRAVTLTIPLLSR